MNTAWRHLHLYGDGKERRYLFDGAAPVRWGANYPDGIPADKWSGDIVSFRVVNDKTKEEVPVRDIRIVPDNPRLPPELILSHTKVPMALDRAGRPVDVEVGAFYFPDWARAYHWLKVWRFAPERRPALGWWRGNAISRLDVA